MAKPGEQLYEQAAAAQDWFLPAILATGPVGACLDAVAQELNYRASFIAAVKANLSFAALPIDTVSDLLAKVRALDNTLRFRLPMLLPERPQAWFRSPVATSAGPFQGALLEAPVFGPYQPAAVGSVERALTEAWTERKALPLPFSEPSDCLWKVLLAYNARLEEISCLPAPFAALRLDVLPEGLPQDLGSRALAAFLMNVRTEIMTARDRLNACYEQLRASSEKLWARQKQEAAAHAQRPRAAADLRAEFRRRRSGAISRQPLLAPADLAALQFMGFRELPAATELRQRYLVMAKQLHPDLQGGDDQAFKQLSSAYARLSAL